MAHSWQEHEQARAGNVVSPYTKEHKLALCHSRSVDPCVFDFIAHNMSEQAAYAALRAMPVNPPRGCPTSGAAVEEER